VEGLVWKTLLLSLLSLAPAPAYSVLTHEALIDSAWADSIRPLLIKRFPDSTAEDLRKAQAYAYGGCIIQDMGYYPFGSRFFSDLTHYARSGDFVVALVRDSQNLNEYAFALGALAHYAADNLGHPIAVNRAVPLEYPKLRERYGDIVTYEDDPVAHLKVEFGFDVVQVAQAHYAPKAYHDFIGFEVAQRLLVTTFEETYGLPMKDVFTSIDLSLGTYRRSVSTLLPEATKAAWHMKKNEIQAGQPGITRKKFIYHLSRASYHREWGYSYERPGPFARFIAFLFRIIPKVGPFKGLDFKPPTIHTERLFEQSFNETLTRYQALLREVNAGTLRLEDKDFDTGKPTAPGEYRRGDQTYAKLVEKLAGQKFQHATGDLKANILAFYANPDAPIETKQHPEDWARVQRALAALAATQPTAAVLPLQ
jgi:hypothetical protein